MDSQIDIDQLLDQANDVDPDIRYMVLRDIGKFLSGKEVLSIYGQLRIDQIINKLIKLLDDAVPDVQNQAVKNFEVLGSALSVFDASLVKNVLKRLFDCVQRDQRNAKKENAVSITSSIYTMALRYFLQNLKEGKKRTRVSQAQLVLDMIFPSIVNAETAVIPSLNYIEILFDLIKYNGTALTDTQISQTIDLLVNSAYKCDGILSAKSINTLGLLMNYLHNNEQAEKVIATAFLDTSGIKNNNPQLNELQIESVRLSILLNLTKSSVDKFSSQIKPIFSLLKSDLYLEKLDTDNDVNMDDEDDEGSSINDDTSKIDEIRDLSLSCVGNLVISGQSDLNAFIDDLFVILKYFLRYDPYTIDDGSEGDDEEDEIDFSDDEYFQDDDLNEDFSYRLRKQAARILGDLIKQADPIFIGKLFHEEIVDLLISRLKDSNESVVGEILVTLTEIVAKVEEFESNDSLYKLLIAKLPAFVKSISENLVKAKNVSSLNNYLRFIAKLIDTAGKYFSSEYITGLLSAIQKFKKSISFNFQLDSELLDTYTAIFKNHNLVGIKSSINSIISDLLIGVSNSARNSALAALDAFTLLVNNLGKHSIDWQQFPNFEKMLDVIIEKACSKQFDSELRAKSTSALALVFSELFLKGTKYIQEILMALRSNLAYDLLSESTIKSIAKAFKSKHNVDEISTQWLIDVINTLLNFIEADTQNSQAPVTSISLETLLEIVEYHKLKEKLDVDGSVKIIETLVQKDFVNPRQTQSKLLIIAVLLSNITQCNISLVEQIMELIQITVSTKNTLEDSYSLLFLSKSFVHKVNAANLFDQLFDPHQYENLTLAEVLSTITVEGHLQQKIVEYEKLLLNGIKEKPLLLFTLNFLGNVSKTKKLEVELNVFLELLQTYHNDEAIKLCVAQNIGRFISRDINLYLPRILKSLESFKNETSEEAKSQKYSLLLAIKQELEIKYNNMVHYNHIAFETSIEPALSLINESNAASIWKVIFEIETKSNDEELDIAELAIGSESLSLICLTGNTFLERLDVYLDSESQWINSSNYLVINTIKQLINQEYFSTVERKQFLLQAKFLKFLKANIESNLISLKQISLNLVLGIVHSCFEEYLAAGLIQDKLLPVILEELKPRSEFIRKIEIGPFKHKMDDGVELRKTVYEILFTLVSSESISKDKAESTNNGLLLEILKKIVEFGLNDKSEIFLITNLMIQKILKEYSLALFENPQLFSTFITRNKKVFNKKMTDKTTKQQADEQKEKVKSAGKTMLKLNNIAQAQESEIKGDEAREWNLFFNEFSHLFE